MTARWLAAWRMLRLRPRPVKRWKGRPARDAILAVDVGGLCVVTAPWLRPEPCVRCARPATGRFNEYGTTRMFAVHAECARAVRAELSAELSAA